MTPIRDRLRAAKEASQLSITDLAIWFGVGYSTTRTWLEGVTPSSYRLPQIEDRLLLLEHAAQAGTFFPVPLEVTQYQRKNYIEGVYNAIAGRISPSRPS